MVNKYRSIFQSHSAHLGHSKWFWPETFLSWSWECSDVTNPPSQKCSTFSVWDHMLMTYDFSDGHLCQGWFKLWPFNQLVTNSLWFRANLWKGHFRIPKRSRLESPFGHVYLRGGFKHVLLFLPVPREMIQFDSYFSSLGDSTTNYRYHSTHLRNLRNSGHLRWGKLPIPYHPWDWYICLHLP